jgi:hypothetical protein
LKSAAGEVLAYLEAVRASGTSAEDRAAENRANAVYDVLERVESPDFFVGVRFRGAPRSTPPARAIRQFVQDRLNEASYETVANAWSEVSGGEAQFPIEWAFNHDGWEVGFFPIPKRGDARGQSEVRPLGIFFHDAHAIDPVSDLRAAVKRKAGRYGELGGPYIIAVNGAGMAADRDAMLKALLGTIAFQFPTSRGPKGGRWVRNPDGVWYGGTAARNTRISAILYVDYTHPTAVASAKLALIENPWARFPPPKLPKFPRLEVQRPSQEFAEVPGWEAYQLLGLENEDFPGRDLD